MTIPSTPPAPAGNLPFAFLAGGGACGALIVGRDWSASPLGPVEIWPQSLRAVLGLLLASPVPMVLLWGEEGVMLYNDAYSAFAGGRHPELLGSKVREGWPEVADFNDNVMRVGLAGRTLAYRDVELTLYRHGAPEQVFMNLDYSPVPGDDGRPAGVLAVVVETTDRVLAQRRAAVESDRLRLMFSQAPGFIARLSGPDHVFEMVNPGYAERIGHREVIGRPIREALPEIVEQGFVEILDQVYCSGEAYIGTSVPSSVRRGPDGPLEERFFDFVYQPLIDESGRVTGIFADGQDVTERVRATRLLETFAEAVPGVVYAKDLEGRMLIANQGTTELIGKPPEEYLGKTDAEFLDDKAQGLAIMANDRRIMESGLPEQIEEEVHLPGGTPAIWLSTKAPLRDAEGRIVGLIGSSVDITARKAAEAALRLERELLRAVIQQAPVGISIAEAPSGRSLALNEKAIEITGHRELGEDAARYALHGARHPDDRPYQVEEYPTIRSLRNGEVVEGEVTVYRRGGRDGVGPYHRVELSSAPVRDEHGHIVAAVTTLVDLEERFQAEEALRVSEEFNRRILASSADCIKVLDLDARLEFMSEGGMCVMEVDDFGAIKGQCWPDFWKGEEHAKALAAVEEAKRGGTGRFQGFATTMKGAPRWWDVIVTPMAGADGRPEKLLSISRDVTTAKQAETALRNLAETLESRVAETTAELRLYQDIVQSDSSPICAFDTDLRLIAFNQAHSDDFFRIMGHRVQLGEVFPDLFPADQALIIRGFMERALAGEIFTIEGDFGDPKLEVPHWEVDYRPIRDEAGAIIGAFHHARDVTPRLRAEAELEAAQEALRQSQKMEAMGQLTGGVAHDFNNLLTPIIGSLDRLLTRGVGSERERRLMAGGLESAERAKTLVQRLLAFARRQPLQPVAVDVAALVNGMAGLIHSTLGPRIDVRVQVISDLPPAHADANQLEMALLNLAVNARDAMPDGGTLTIAAARESVRPHQKTQLKAGHYVRLSVTDTGIGMDAATLERATEPFFSTKGIGRGTGLGLSMVHGLVAQLGGGLTIVSKPGQGTTVNLWLPISAEPAGAAEEEPTTRSQVQARGQALLVDDEDLVRMSTADMLVDMGFDVLEAGSAEDALQILHRGTAVDLLVTDHLMPGMNGADLARKAKALQPSLPVLIVSGYAEAAGVAPDLPRLVKPFRASELAGQVVAIMPDAAVQ